MTGFNILQGDCLDVIPTLDDRSIDSIVTDPPYGLSFMGKDWDYGVPGVHFWVEALRVAKPGAYLLAFGGTRTFHRLTVAIEDAGWEIRDCIGWLYGSGFPKSLNIGNGFGTALKPAWEPIIMARKPIIGTVANNVLKYGTGAMNIDGCRVSVDPTIDDMLRTVQRGKRESETWEKGSGFKNENNHLTGVPEKGRFPANIIHDGSDEVVQLFPITGEGNHPANRKTSFWSTTKPQKLEHRATDSGSAARFFYCAKASKHDRDEGCECLKAKKMGFSNGAQLHGEGYDKGQDIGLNRVISRKNNHPTVKPTALMRYLCKLVTPPGGIILDPFMGSGSTGKAAALEGFRFIGIELESDYTEIAGRRIKAVQPLFAGASL